jgi:hypothetical protein
MEILINENGYVDLKAPIYMTEEQRKCFIEGMKKIFTDVQVIDVEEQIVEMPKREAKPVVDWKNPKNLYLLTKGLTNEEIARELGVSDEHIFAIQLKRAEFVPKIQQWARKKGITQITEKDVEEFLKEMR